MNEEKKGAPRKEYTLKSPEGAGPDEVLLIQAGEEKRAGEKVHLREDQAARLRESGRL
jgi:hypothetical protein